MADLLLMAGALRLYCCPCKDVHTIELADVERIVYALGAMVTDAITFGLEADRTQAEQRATDGPDCLLDVLERARVGDCQQFADLTIDNRTESGPDDDVVDAHIVDFEDQLRTAIAHQWAAIRALENTSDGPGERIAAARALLRYDLDAEPTDGGAVVALETQRAAVLAIHKPDEFDECVYCHIEPMRAAPWPCPTARALGVRS